MAIVDTPPSYDPHPTLHVLPCPWDKWHVQSPLLTRQYSNYTAGQLRTYRSHDRHNDVYARMRTIAGVLTGTGVAELAAYYAAAYR